jgi:hypothetical protein
MKNEKKNETGLILGLFIIAILAILMVLTFHFGFEVGRVEKGPTSVVTGLYFQLWGILFLLSYFFSHKTFFLRGLIWFCENLSNPKSRKTAFIWFVLAFGLGTMSLIKGLGVGSDDTQQTSYTMYKIDVKSSPALVPEYSANDNLSVLNNTLLSTSFENLKISEPSIIIPFLNQGDELWQVQDRFSRSGRHCLNVIPQGNGSSVLSRLFQSFSNKEHNYAILNSIFSDSYVSFDVSMFDRIELEFWRYSTSNPKKRADFNCGSSLKIYYRIDNGEWQHKMSYCGQHKSETTVWRQSKLEFPTEGHATIEFKFVYEILSPKRDPKVFYLIDDLRVVGKIG